MKKKMFVAMVLCVFLGGVTQAATITTQTDEPVVNSSDIAQLLTCTADTENIDGPGQTASGNNDGSTYVANDRTTQGQTFTMSAGGMLNGIWVKHVGWDTFLANGTFASFNDGDQITVRICSFSGTTLTVLSSEVATMATGSGFSSGGDSGTDLWLHIVLDTPVDLAPGAYAFDLTSYGPWFETDGLDAGPYAGGQAYSTTAKESLDMGTVHTNGDRTFLLELEPTLTAPHDPQAIPQNDDGSVGTVNIADLTVTNVDLTFKAGADPNYPDNGSIVRSDTESFVIRLQTGAPTDPNLYIVDAIAAGSMTDPNRFFELSAYDPAGVLKAGTTYKWQVEQVLTNPLTSLPYAAGDPNNILGGIWSFTTVSAVPEILTDPDHTLTDFTGAATLTVEASAVADNYRWFRVVGEQDTGGLVDDIELSDGGVYSTTQTDTLTITGLASDGSQDAQYYAIAYNGVPGDALTQESGPSAAAWVWYPRETNRYTFEDAPYVVDSNSFIADTIGASDIQLVSDDTGDDLASIDPNNPNAPGLLGTHSLYFNNPNANDPNNVDGQYARISDTDFCAYKDITISAWIYHKGGGWQRILSVGSTDGSGTNGVNTMYFTPAGNGTSGRLMLNVNGQSVIAPDGSVPENEWAYVTATLSGDVAKLYVNGEWVATNDSLTNNPIDNAPAGNIMLARSQWWNYDTLFNGYIADLRIWNYGLTTDDVAQAYMDDDTNAGYVCESEINNLPYDYNDNCIIDLGDFAFFAETWLDSYRIYQD